MKVYVLSESWDYDTSNVLGAYSTVRKAKLAGNKVAGNPVFGSYGKWTKCTVGTALWMRSRSSSQIEIQEVEVDK